MGESRPFHHSVQLYHEESDLVDALARFAEGGLAQGEGVVLAELDAARLAEVRQSLPALQHRSL